MAGHLREECAGNALYSKGKACVLKGAFVPKTLKHLHIGARTLVGHSVKKFVRAGVTVTEPRGGGDGLFRHWGMAKKRYAGHFSFHL